MQNHKKIRIYICKGITRVVTSYLPRQMMSQSPNTDNPEPGKGLKGYKIETKKLSEIIFDSKIYGIRIVVGRAQETVFFQV